MSKDEKVKHTPGEWPKFHLRSADGRTTAVSREFAVNRFSEQTVSWLESGQIVGSDKHGEHLSLYTLEDSVRAAAPELLEALQHLTLLIHNMVDIYEVQHAKWLINQDSFINAEAAISKATGQAEKVSA